MQENPCYSTHQAGFIQGNSCFERGANSLVQRPIKFNLGKPRRPSETETREDRSIRLVRTTLNSPETSAPFLLHEKLKMKIII